MLRSLLLSIAVSAIAVTVSRGTIFKPFRDGLRVPFFHDLVSCGYCLSHWLAAVAVLAFGGPIRVSFPLVNWFLNTMLMVAMAMPWIAGITRLLVITGTTDNAEMARLRGLLAESRQVIAKLLEEREEDAEKVNR